MRTIGAELIKLKRSMAWVIVLILPIVLAVTGVVNTLVDGAPLEDGWHTLWLRSVVFYGLFPLAIGIGVLASLVWRSEHHGSNWNALMSGPTRSSSIVVAKTAAVALPAVTMQLVMLGAVVVLGKTVFGLPGMLPAEYLLVSGLVALSSVPVAALQSGLSMLLRSFAAPIAVALVGSGLSAALLTMNVEAVIFVSPYGLVSRATQLGTESFADDGIIGVAIVVSILIAAALLTTLVIATVDRVLEHRDTRI
ncbi:ABC transporter permease [Tsukamurella sp. 1534]|uniref:ABC transporter permease n=1 Tax=Tsukamurella sp. 1534 TaxID=1151061 RepID=UPI0002DE9752|nr:ABC transporter permease [Tsukamurella sp. 1534]